MGIKQDKEVNISPNTTHKDSNKSPKNETDPGDNGVSGEDSNISKEESGKSPKDQREPSEISSGSNETLPDKTKKDKAEPGDSGKGSGTKNKEPKSETGPVDSGEGSGYTNKKDNEGQIDKPISTEDNTKKPHTTKQDGDASNSSDKVHQSPGQARIKVQM